MASDDTVPSVIRPSGRLPCLWSLNPPGTEVRECPDPVDEVNVCSWTLSPAAAPLYTAVG
jgi:hypothetical protein